MSEMPITFFLPFGEGYGKPGLTIRTDSVEELNSIFAQLSEGVDPSDADSLSKLDELLTNVDTIRAAVLLKFPQEPKQAKTSYTKPAEPTQANASGHVCAHGPMKYKEGTGAKGAWKGFFCTAPRGTQQCDVQWVK